MPSSSDRRALMECAFPGTGQMGYLVGSVTYWRPDGVVHWNVPVGELVGLPSGVLFEPVVVAALRILAAATHIATTCLLVPGRRGELGVGRGMIRLRPVGSAIGPVRCGE